MINLIELNKYIYQKYGNFGYPILFDGIYYYLCMRIDSGNGYHFETIRAENLSETDLKKWIRTQYEK